MGHTETEGKMSLIGMADRLADATVNEMNRVAACRKDAERVKKSLPTHPKRGSYYWWAQLCRQYTGAHFLDSGSAYGYQYQRGVLPEDGPHEFVEINRGKVQYFSMNTIKFLNTHFDAATDEAVAIEKVLNWVGLWFYPTESWGNVIRDFPAALKELFGCIVKYNKPILCQTKSRRKSNTVAEVVRKHLEDLVYASDLRSWQQDLTDDEYVTQALADLPAKEIKLLHEMKVEDASENGRDIYDNPGTFYTYGRENDFNQDWQVQMWFVDREGGLHAVIQSHNGADARGGFSGPVAATVGDVDYLFDWQFDGYCRNCTEQYYDIFHYGKELKKNIPETDIESLKAQIQFYKERNAGQLEIEGMEREWEDFNIDAAGAIVKYMEEYLDYYEKDAETPTILAEEDDKLVVVDDGENSFRPLDGLYFLCPSCGNYTVGFRSCVEGY